MKQVESRVYLAGDCAVFWKVRQEWGELSNFHPDFPVEHEGHVYPTGEHLYQALKFEGDRRRYLIRSCSSAYAAKQLSREKASLIRLGWEKEKVEVMRLVLALKASQHAAIREVLENSGGVAIVERSSKDSFWGALFEKEALTGCNVLGRLWMERRAALRKERREASK